jgi:hypothetical protein
MTSVESIDFADCNPQNLSEYVERNPQNPAENAEHNQQNPDRHASTRPDFFDNNNCISPSDFRRVRPRLVTFPPLCP